MEQFDLKMAIADMRAMALDGLPRMYRSDTGLFAFRLRRVDGRDRLEGISRRYTAIVLIALAGEAEDTAREMLHGRTPEEVCGQLIDDGGKAVDPGDIALTLWAARALDHPRTNIALKRLQAMRPDEITIPTVELAWSLTSLVYPGSDAGDEALADRIYNRLKASYRAGTALFSHHAAGSAVSRLRSHVCCYADLVYPIQALSWLYRAIGDPESLDIAQHCAERMCALQGPAGQWWWHYDIRTGKVLERFPVYAVHQDSMGPMALFALRDAGGDDHSEAVECGVRWLYEPVEQTRSLVDHEAMVIWRKVARREPNKLSRRMQAAISSAHPAWRMPGVNVLFPPRSVDYESRPYHLGWILHAWPASRGEAEPVEKNDAFTSKIGGNGG